MKYLSSDNFLRKFKIWNFFSDFGILKFLKKSKTSLQIVLDLQVATMSSFLCLHIKYIYKDNVNPTC